MKAAVALLVWTALIWTTRLLNIARGDEPVWRLVLPLAFTVFGAAAAVALWRGDRRIVAAFAGWTVAVWAVRILQIRSADHSGAFVAVHSVLAVVSVVLAVLAAREVGANRLSPAVRRG